ncbi:MAG TPA: TlpA disulfide reductase family protein [Bordetella sp.]
MSAPRRRLLRAGLAAALAVPAARALAAPAQGPTDAALKAATGPNWATWKGGPAPSLDLPDLEGHTRGLDEFLGLVVIVNFWATWCEPCQEEIPALSALADSRADDGLRLLAVNNAESREKIDAFLDHLQIQGLVLQDRNGAAVRDWKVVGMPANFVVDRDGKIRLWHLGALDWTKPAVLDPVTALL